MNASDIIRQTAQALYMAGHFKGAESTIGLLVAAHEAQVDPNAHNVRSVEVTNIMAAETMLSTDGNWMPRLRDAHVFAFGWPNKSTQISETHQVFSDGKWHVTGDWWIGMVGNGPFVAKHRRGGVDRALVAFPRLHPRKNYYGKYTLIGSQRNWGHWMHDHMGIIAAARALPDAHERKLVFGMLTPKQRNCLHLADVRDDEMIELPCSVGGGTSTYFEDLAVPSGMSFRQRADNVRMWARKTASIGPSPSKVYISRSDGRVANKADVDALFRAHGYDVIEDIAARPIREQMRIFVNATHLAWSFGADAVAAAMCGLDTRAVVLHPTFRHGREHDEWTAMDFGLRILPVFGSEVDSLEEPCIYNLDSIAHALEAR